MKAAITALGTATPPHGGAQSDIACFMGHILNMTPIQQKKLTRIYQQTGIDHRYSILPDYTKLHGDLSFFSNTLADPFPSTAKRMQLYQEHALPLALSAIADCFSCHPSFDKNTLSHLITVSCTGMYAPGLDLEIALSLNLSMQTHRTAIQFMGCYAVLNALKMADMICRANPNAKVLIVSVELCTLHVQQSQALSHLISGAIFADGAGAIIVETSQEHHKALILDRFYCDVLPETQSEMAWTIGDSGFNMSLSPYVSEAIQKNIAQFLARLLTHTLDKKLIDFYAIHPGGKKILQSCEEALGITLEDNRFSYTVLRCFGNMSSASIIFVLKQIWQGLSKVDDRKNIFSCAFGPGLTLESALLSVEYS